MLSSNGICALVFANERECEKNARSLVTGIASGAPVEQVGATSDHSYMLLLDTRYYTCDVLIRSFHNFNALKAWSQQDKTDEEYLGVLIFQLDAHDLDDVMLEEVRNVFMDLNFDSRVILIRTDNSKDTIAKLQQLCIDEYIELIELEPSEDTKEMLAEYGESGGMRRLREVIDCVSWPNTKQKPNPISQKSHRAYLERVIADLDESQEPDEQFADKSDNGRPSSSSSQPKDCVPEESNQPESTIKSHDFGPSASGGDVPFEEQFCTNFGIDLTTLRKQLEQMQNPEQRKEIVCSLFEQFCRENEDEDSSSNESEQQEPPASEADVKCEANVRTTTSS